MCGTHSRSWIYRLRNAPIDLFNGARWRAVLEHGSKRLSQTVQSRACSGTVQTALCEPLCGLEPYLLFDLTPQQPTSLDVCLHFCNQTLIWENIHFLYP